MKILVYGTLKHGYWNFEDFLDGFVTSIEEATVDGYTLYDVGFPLAVPTPGSRIRGELMEVPTIIASEVRDRLDMLEGHPHAYTRTKVTVKRADGSEVLAWMYVANCDPTKMSKESFLGESWPSPVQLKAIEERMAERRRRAQLMKELMLERSPR